VLDFSDEEYERFIANWTLTIEAALGPAGQVNETVRVEAARRQTELLQGVLTNERVRALAVNPLLLTVIAWYINTGPSCRKNRAEFVQRVHRGAVGLLGNRQAG